MEWQKDITKNKIKSNTKNRANIQDFDIKPMPADRQPQQNRGIDRLAKRNKNENKVLGNQSFRGNIWIVFVKSIKCI